MTLPEEMIKQQEKDKKELASLPKGTNKPISWCSEHDCKLPTCFSIHYPSSISKKSEINPSPCATLSKELQDRLLAQLNITTQLEMRIEELLLALEESKSVAIYWQTQYENMAFEIATVDMEKSK